MFGSYTPSERTFGRNAWLFRLLTAFLTTLASEIKLVPFEGEEFRFGLGSIAFFLAILIWPQASVLLTGITTGLLIVGVRTIEGVLFQETLWSAGIISHSPVFLFYFLFALGFHLIKIERYKTIPLLLGGWASLIEIIANGAEQLARYGLQQQVSLSLVTWGLIVSAAFVRSYFVVGVYSSITISEQKKRMQDILQVGSKLYAETLYLQKSMNRIEQISTSSHDLYRKLKKKELHLLSMQALQIAEEIHDVQKDSERILSDLTKLSLEKMQNKLKLSDILHLVVVANERYSELLRKEITFDIEQKIDYETDQQLQLLSLLNHLTTNSVESISEKGNIHIHISEEDGHTVFVIMDTGKGISEEDVPVVFEPGYTTKFDEHGMAASGIGLSHVKEIIDSLKGMIKIETPEEGTVFIISLPTKSIRK